MYSLKQIFLVLSILSVASAKKGLSVRNSNSEVEARRGLKKSKSGGGGGGGGGSGFVNPNRGGGIVGVGVNRDGTPPGTLLQPAGKACVPFQDAEKWLTADYPGDAQCRAASGAMGASSACCRVFSFTDTNGPQKWLLYDSNNQYRDLMCVCNENTGGGTANNPVIGTPIGAPVSPPGQDTTDRTGDIGGAIPPTPPGLSVCANPNPTQIALQSSPGMTGCVSSDECAANRCCSSKNCVCMPMNFMGNAYCT